MDVPAGLKMLARTGTDQHRLQDMQEVQQIKDKLARDGCHNMGSAFYEGQNGPTSMMNLLSKACMHPEDMEWKPGARKYPRASDIPEWCEAGEQHFPFLMKNPYPKAKKKKGKKGKKKK